MTTIHPSAHDIERVKFALAGGGQELLL